MQEVFLPVSIGEALDKLSILEIKNKKIIDIRKHEVLKEYNLVKQYLQIYLEKYNYYYRLLYNINLKIWKLQDKRRLNLKLYKIIFRENQKRFRIKNKINKLTNSSIKEQKGYSIKRIIIDGRISLGYMFLINGSIRYLSLLYDEVFIYCKKIHEEILTKMYCDDPCIKVLIDNLPNNCKIYSINDLKSFRKNYFNIETTEEAIKLKNIYSMNYIIVENPTETLLENNKNILILDFSKNVYSKENNPIEWEFAEKVINRPILDYKLLLEGAKELHLIESDLFCFASRLNLDKVDKKVIYLS